MSIKTKNLFFALVDFLTFYFSLFLALLIRHNINFNLEIFKIHLFPFFIIFIVWFLIFYIFDLYDFKKISFFKEYSQNYLSALFISLFLTILIFYLVPLFKISPKTLLLIFIVIFVPLNLEIRNLLLEKISSKSFKTIILIGETKEINEIENYLNSHKSLGFKKIIKHKRLGELIEDDFDYLVISNTILKNTEMPSGLINKFLEGKYIFSSSVFIENFLNKISLENLTYEWFSENVLNKDELYEIVKRIIDITLAFFSLIFSLPLWPFIILGIKISSPGPIFFKDLRVGKGEGVFILYKFRTMHTADYKNPEKENVFGVKGGDKRIFLFGKILRRLHLDELPQAFNVIKGDISIVGPRPDSKPYYDFLKNKICFYRLRTLIKPGITGWAQTNEKTGDFLEEAKERLEYDLYYFKNRNLLLDFLIILRTLKIIFTFWGK